MCAGPPATLDCKKRMNSRLEESRQRVDGFPATTFVTWVNRCSMACSLMHSRAVSLSLKSYVHGAAHHWQKWNVSFFSPWHLKVVLCRKRLIHVSVFSVGYELRCTDWALWP